MLREGEPADPRDCTFTGPQGARATFGCVENLYVYSSQGLQKVPLRSVSSVTNEMVTERIRRQEHFRTIGVHAFPQPGVLPSEILSRSMPQLTAFKNSLPPGYRMQIGGEQACRRRRASPIWRGCCSSRSSGSTLRCCFNSATQ